MIMVPPVHAASVCGDLLHRRRYSAIVLLLQWPLLLQLVSAAVHCQCEKALRRNVASLEANDWSHSAQRRKRLR